VDRYADDAFLHAAVSFEYEAAWDEYMEQVESFASGCAPYMVAPGNHEAECHSPACLTSPSRAKALGNFSAYNARFRMPSPESGGAANMWYSFDHGLVHVATINTETDFPNAPGDNHNPLKRANGGFGGGDWLAWLEADLASVDRKVTPWVIVGGHRPLYTVDDSTSDGQPTGDPAHLAAAVEGLFERYHVDFYLCGHKHAYERSYPVYAGAVPNTSYTDPQHTVHLLSGAGGQDEGHDSYGARSGVGWSAVVDTTHWGHGVLSIRSATEAIWTELDAADGSAFDSVTIRKRSPSGV
jgi:acid phosphatase type 7